MKRKSDSQNYRSEEIERKMQRTKDEIWETDDEESKQRREDGYYRRKRKSTLRRRRKIVKRRKDLGKREKRR